MRPDGILTKLMCLIGVSMLCSGVVVARDQGDTVRIAETKSFRVVHGHAEFDIVQSFQFFNRRSLTTLDYLDFPLGGSAPFLSLAPRPDRRGKEEKIADTFVQMVNYPGGTWLYNTVCAGLDLMTYYEDITSIKYENLKIGGGFGGAGRGFLQTGVFYNF